MIQFSYDDFVKATAKQSSDRSTVGKRVGFFGLKNNGESAVVRFDLGGPEDIKIFPVHSLLTKDGKRRNVFCLRSPQEPLDKCPLCESGETVSWRALIKVIRYTVTDTGVEAEPTFWSAPLSVGKTLKAFAADYENLRDYVFKVTREGGKGDTRTSYTIVPANPNIYKSEVYVADFSLFDNFNMNFFVMERTPDDMHVFLREGEFPNPYAKQETSVKQEETFTPKQTSFDLGPNTQYTEEKKEEIKTPTPGPRRYTY